MVQPENMQQELKGGKEGRRLRSWQSRRCQGESAGGPARSSAERGLRVRHQELPREVKSCRQDGTEGQDAELVGWNEKQDLP